VIAANGRTAERLAPEVEVVAEDEGQLFRRLDVLEAPLLPLYRADTRIAHGRHSTAARSTHPGRPHPGTRRIVRTATASA